MIVGICGLLFSVYLWWDWLASAGIGCFGYNCGCCLLGWLCCSTGLFGRFLCWVCCGCVVVLVFLGGLGNGLFGVYCIWVGVG